MKEKQFHVMGDPELDLIFTEAYRKTLKRVEKTEREKEFRDHVDAMSDLFEQELSSRDLEPEEIKEFLRAFRRQIEHAEKDLRDRRAESRRLKRMGVIIFLSVLAISGLIYIGIGKPFTTISRIETELAEEFTKVEEGYGSHADDYYGILSKYSRRLGPDRTREYSDVMYEELNRQYETLVKRVEAGEVAYYDDARKWAGYFPEKEDRKARRSRADTAMAKWVGRAVDESVDRVIEEAKELIEQVKDN